jgi:hypothetical protein
MQRVEDLYSAPQGVGVIRGVSYDKAFEAMAADGSAATIVTKYVGNDWH